MHYLDYNEKKQHGTMDFPIEYYHVDEHHPRYNMPFHCHKELEIIRILEGILFLKLDDEEFEERMRDMCNLGEALELEARQEASKRKNIEYVRKLMERLQMSFKEAVSLLEIPEKEIEEIKEKFCF
mgnify:CR=1 FL=1